MQVYQGYRLCTGRIHLQTVRLHRYTRCSTPQTRRDTALWRQKSTKTQCLTSWRLILWHLVILLIHTWYLVMLLIYRRIQLIELLISSLEVIHWQEPSTDRPSVPFPPLYHLTNKRRWPWLAKNVISHFWMYFLISFGTGPSEAVCGPENPNPIFRSFLSWSQLHPSLGFNPIGGLQTVESCMRATIVNFGKIEKSTFWKISFKWKLHWGFTLNENSSVNPNPPADWKRLQPTQNRIDIWTSVSEQTQYSIHKTELIFGRRFLNRLNTAYQSV